MTDKPLTPKQQAFIAAYVGEAKGNATQAARLAGYTGGDAACSVMGSQLLRNPKVCHALDVFRMATATNRIMSAEEAAERLSRIGRGDTDLTEKRVVNGGAAGFVDVETPPQFCHQIDAIKTLSKMRGYEAPTKTEVSGVVGVMALTADQDAALADWLLVRDDPRVIAVLAERRGDV